MYTENVGKDMLLFSRAVMTNQLARFAPGWFMALTHHTGRGDGEGDAQAKLPTDYFFRCFHDYREHLGYCETGFRKFLQGKALLEYGPGDTLGMALLLYAHGAEFVHCVDRFPLERASERTLRTYHDILDRLDGEVRQRACGAFHTYGDPASGFDPERIRYSVTSHGLVNERDSYDVILSRSVLEHVDRLDTTLDDMALALKPGGLSIHKVDLKSHNSDRYQPYDFLTWPEPLYRWMYSHKGRPNRWRVDKYRECVQRAGLKFRELSDTGRLDATQIERIRPKLATRFRDLPTDELSWLGFWMVLEHA